MPRFPALPHALFLGISIIASAVAADAPPWRSALYPENWQPGFHDARGHFLHDFSYAGYHRAEVPIPDVRGPITDATQAPYHADASGKQDATGAIQQALDTIGKAGGGVVYLPAGIYRIQPPESSSAALKIRYAHTILRGAGADKTFLCNDTFLMREKHIIEVRADEPANWYSDKAYSLPLPGDIIDPTDRIVLPDVSALQVGDLVVLRSDITPRFIESVGMSAKWTPENTRNRGLCFARRIVAVDPDTKTIRIDVPTRYPLLKVDNARLVKLGTPMVQECALEDFSLGNKQNPKDGWLEDDFTKPGLGAYDAHASVAVWIESAENCWVRRVRSYCPAGNQPRVHLLSFGIKLLRSRFVTVTNCDLRHAQCYSGGGNGYLYNIQGQDCLLENCYAEDGRHNYDFGQMATCGNVITHCTTRDGRLASDYHMYLSMANLIECMTCDGDFLEAKYRPYGVVAANNTPEHGVTTTQSVFWNIRGARYTASPFIWNGEEHRRPQVLVESKQCGDGYVIGTSGPADKVDSTNFVEGEGKGETLVPQSLYQDQLKRRLAR